MWNSQFQEDKTTLIRLSHQTDTDTLTTNLDESRGTVISAFIYESMKRSAVARRIDEMPKEGIFRDGYPRPHHQ